MRITRWAVTIGVLAAIALTGWDARMPPASPTAAIAPRSVDPTPSPTAFVALTLSAPSLPVFAASARRPVSPPSSGSLTRSRVVGTMTVDHPTAWRLVRPQVSSHGPSTVASYLTNQPTRQQCTTAARPSGRTVVTCQSPVDSLQPNGVFVTFVDAAMGARPLTSVNRFVAGRPAVVRPGLLTGACPRGTSGAVEMRTFVPPPQPVPALGGDTVIMLACYAGPDTARAAADVDALIDSLSST